MANICAFWDEIEDDGWARVTRMHHQPLKLDAEARAAGLVVTLPRTPITKPGWSAALYVNPSVGGVEWRVNMDPDYRMPAGEFLALLPATTRVQARALASSDPVIADFLGLIDMLVIDNAATGIHPGGRGAKEGLGYLVSIGLMTDAQMREITEP